MQLSESLNINIERIETVHKSVGIPHNESHTSGSLLTLQKAVALLVDTMGTRTKYRQTGTSYVLLLHGLLHGLSLSKAKTPQMQMKLKRSLNR